MSAFNIKNIIRAKHNKFGQKWRKIPQQCWVFCGPGRGPIIRSHCPEFLPICLVIGWADSHPPEFEKVLELVPGATAACWSCGGGAGRAGVTGVLYQGSIWPMAATLFPWLVPVVDGGGARCVDFLNECLTDLMLR